MLSTPSLAAPTGSRPHLAEGERKTMSSRTPTLPWVRPVRRPDDRPPYHFSVPGPDVLATSLLWFIVMIGAAILGLALGGA